MKTIPKLHRLSFSTQYIKFQNSWLLLHQLVMREAQCFWSMDGRNFRSDQFDLNKAQGNSNQSNVIQFAQSHIANTNNLILTREALEQIRLGQ